MGTVIRIDEWRAGRKGFRPPVAHDASMERLEAAVRRLDSLTEKVLGRGERLDPPTETALLAIVGEVSMGLVDEAASRAEQLADRLGERAG